MKFYPNTATAVITILEKVFIEKSYADKVIEHVLKNNTKWGSRDRKFVAECAYDIIRWKRLMEAIIQKRAEDNEGFWEPSGLGASSTGTPFQTGSPCVSSTLTK